MRAVAYIRVSSVEQIDGHSLDAQERLFRELCANKGWEAISVYRDEGKSAHNDAIAKRPAFKDLLEDARKGLFDTVVVHTLDRWSRNLRVTIETLSTLARYQVGLISITENIDWSNPEGRLFTQMLGAFSEYYSGALANHVRKGQSQRAREGLHTGGIPFGYESCWRKDNGTRVLVCSEEHPGGLHVQTGEGKVVARLFEWYSSGIARLADLATWLNDSGFRTRNMHRTLEGPQDEKAKPRYFTTSSVRTILHNPFYSGFVKHNDEQFPGLHESLISKSTFDRVQLLMRKNSGRSETLNPRPERQYLLKGLIRCAYCGLPMWSQTYYNGNRYYREHKNSRSTMQCPAGGGSITCDIADEQVSKLIQAIVLDTDWIDQVMALIGIQDEQEKVSEQRRNLEERKRRLGKAFVEGMYSDTDYEREKHYIDMELETLVVPQADETVKAGELIENLPELWEEANMEERRKLLLAMLDAVYFDTKESKSVVAIQPKAGFLTVFQVATTRNGHEVQLIKRPQDHGSEAGPCFWWRRGGVEPPVQKALHWDMLQAYPALVFSPGRPSAGR